MTPSRETGRIGTPDIEAILADPNSKVCKDLRDRAAYVFVTGIYPSHLRPFFTQALSLITTSRRDPTALDGLSGVMKVDDALAKRLAIEEHPMVRKVRAMVADGYRIKASRGRHTRKPFTKVFFARGAQRLTIQIDGSTKDGWE